MTMHRTGTRKEWLAARLELLQAEKELTRRGDELARRRQELPWVRIDKAYRFETDDGNASLADLFRGRSQLLVYHFMFGPDYTAGCPACSAIADGFNGFVVRRPGHGHGGVDRPRRRARHPRRRQGRDRRPACGLGARQPVRPRRHAGVRPALPPHGRRVLGAPAALRSRGLRARRRATSDARLRSRRRGRPVPSRGRRRVRRDRARALAGRPAPVAARYAWHDVRSAATSPSSESVRSSSSVYYLIIG